MGSDEAKESLDDSFDTFEAKPERMEAEEEECSVCRNGMTAPTALSDCIHVFCYECIVAWLTKGSGLFCPMCKTPVRFVRKKSSEEKVSVEAILANKEPVATASEDVITEKRIVSRKMRSCRRMMNRIDEIIGSSSRSSNPSKTARVAELNTMKRLCVAQLNSLQMLREDIDHGATKALVVSKLPFRRLVYERQVLFDGLSVDNPAPTRREFLADIEHHRMVLNSFLKVELKAIPVKNQPPVDKENNWHFYTLSDILGGGEEEMFNKLFDAITERGMRHLTADDIEVIFKGMVTIRVANCFWEQLRSLVSSKKTFLEWCGSIRYRSRTDTGGEGPGNEEIVTVDDGDDNDEAIEERNVNRRRRLLPDFPTTLLNTRTMANFLSDVSCPPFFNLLTGSLRIPVTAYRPPLWNPTASRVVPTAGISWSDLTRPVATRRSRNVPVVDLDDDDDDEQNREEREDEEDDDEDDIQVVEPEPVPTETNRTITLDESMDSRPGPSEKPVEKNGRKRRSDSAEERGDRKRQRADAMPPGLVDDVQKLIEKYRLSKLNALNTLVDATQDAICRMGTSGSSSSLPKKVDPEASSFENRLKNRGISAWSESAPTQSIND